jgi:Protein of unknown function (DUF2917)
MQASWIVKVLSMPKSSAMRMSDAKSTRLSVQDGLVWITEEGVDEDFFLSAGQTYVVHSDGLVIVSAESDVRIAVGEKNAANGVMRPLRNAEEFA